MVMPSSNSSAEVHFLAGRFPGLVGHLYSPGGGRGPYRWLPYGIDNGVFGAFTRQVEWDSAPFMRLLEWAQAKREAPRWLVVPDSVGDAQETLQVWSEWERRLRPLGIPLAFAAQDGHEPADVPASADVVFIGGSTDWKRAAILPFCERHPRVHVGRINTVRWLRYCRDCGAESCDGTGWFRGDQKQLEGLRAYLRETSEGTKQRELFRSLPVTATAGGEP